MPRRTIWEIMRDMVARDFACKVRERMRRDRNPLLVTVQDKFALRSYAEARGVQTAPLLFVSDTVEDLPFHALPSDCFLKTNHACGRNILRVDSQFFLFGDGSGLLNGDGAISQATAASRMLSLEACIQQCREWLSTPYRAEEWAYLQMAPKLMVEEILFPRDGGELKDFRFYTFDGRVRAINVGSPSYRQRGENIFLDPEWNQIELTRYTELPDPFPARPECLREMVAAAERLGRGLDFVRVDLYDTTRGVVLGEMTVYPEAGGRGTPTACPKFNRWLGAQWKPDRRFYRS